MPTSLIDWWSSTSRSFRVITIVGGALTAGSGAIAGVPVAWKTLGLPEIASRSFVLAQYKMLEDKTTKIYEFQRSDRIERLEETADQLDIKIKELNAKLPD